MTVSLSILFLLLFFSELLLTESYLSIQLQGYQFIDFS